MQEKLSSIVYDVIGETYLNYGDSQVVAATIKALNEGNMNMYTNKNKNGRKRLINKLQEMGEFHNQDNPSFNYTFFNGILDCYLESLIKKGSPKDNVERMILSTYSGISTDPIFIKDMRKQIISAKQITTESLQEFSKYKNPLYSMIDTICITYERERRAEKQALIASNIQVHVANMEGVKEGMITGLTRIKEGTVKVGNLSAATNIGRRRKNQEDALLIKEHPKNPNFKILVVSDGVGGCDKGEFASDYTIKSISNWFEQLPITYYEDSKGLTGMLNYQIQKISREIHDRYNGIANATFVGGIVCENETLIANVGDSRAYIYSEEFHDFLQVTRDDSFVEVLHQTGEIKERDDMRFHVNSNKIFQCLGDANIKPKIYIVRNQDYDRLILMSDGVSDCLSDKDMLVINKNTPREYLAEVLVKSAINHDSYARAGLSEEMYRNVIQGGKDNTTAVVYDKKISRKGSDEYDI